MSTGEFHTRFSSECIGGTSKKLDVKESNLKVVGKIKFWFFINVI
jgi:hypothetical protein